MRIAAILIAALAVASCDAGSDTAAPPEAASEPPLERMYRTLATYNSVVISRFHLQGEARGADVLCSPFQCRTAEPHPILGSRPTMEGRHAAFTLGEAIWTTQGEIGGLRIWEIDRTDGASSYGARLDHSFFENFTGREEVRPGIVGEVFGRIYRDAPIPV